MKKKIASLVVFISVILILVNTNFAVELNLKTTEEYNLWNELSDEEKQNYIQPCPFIIENSNQSNTFKNSRIGQFANLKASYQEKYKIDNLTVKDQQNTNECWAFSLTSAIESNLYKRLSNNTILLSPRHMDYTTSYTFLDGINTKGYNREVGSGGNAYIGLGYCTSGKGPIYESEMPFQNNEDKIYLNEIENKNKATQIKEYVDFPTLYKRYSNGNIEYYNGGGILNKKIYSKEEVTQMRNQIKEHIIKYGAISSYTYAGTQESLNYYNLGKVENGQAENFAYYCDKQDAIADHAVTIVGWDDTYSANNFNDSHKPTSDGAYIVLNSYGTDSFNQGYLYISYEDVLIERNMIGIIETSDITYDNLYQYDELGYNFSYIPTTTSNENVSQIFAGNIFYKKNLEDSRNEELTEVSFYLPIASEVSIYANTKDTSLQDGVLLKDVGILNQGYHTVTLDQPVEITGDGFSVYLKLKSDVVEVPLELNYKTNDIGSNLWDTATSEKGQSFVSLDSKKWYDLVDLNVVDTNICLKAFTKYADVKENINVEQIILNQYSAVMNQNDKLELTATVFPNNSTKQNINWQTSDINIASIEKVDNNKSVVTAKSAGKCTITAFSEDGKVFASCEITVNGQDQIIPINKIVVDESEKILYVGEKIKINFKIEPSNATNQNITYISSDTNIATVTSDGEITAVSEGKTTIQLLNQESGVSTSIVVNVVKKELTNNIQNGQNQEQIVNVTEDDTTAKTILPKTGKNYIIIICLGVIILIGTIKVIWLYRNREVK